jgi:hypothetical protein
MDCTMLYLDWATKKKEACALAVRRRAISVDLPCCTSTGAFMIEFEQTGWCLCHHVFLARLMRSTPTLNFHGLGSCDMTVNFGNSKGPLTLSL